MRFAVLLGLIGLAIASSKHWSSDINEERFRSGREFRYRFDGILSAGISVPNSQKAITRIQSLVTLIPESDNTVLLQLSQLRFASSQDETSTLLVTPIERMDRITLEEEHERVLSLPIRFVYKHGLIGEIEFVEDELTWSANIKKAVLNMLQVNMLRKGETVERHELLENVDNFFVAVERTLEGECEVVYTKVDETKEVQQWTKSINFEKCTVRPDIRYGRRFVEKCEECELTTSDDKMSSTVLTFNVTGTTEDFLIRDVELKSKMLFAPIGENNQLIVSVVYNKMFLVYAGKVENRIRFVRGTRKENLIYNVEQEVAEEMFAMTGEEKYLRQLPVWNNKVELVKKMLVKLSKHFETELELETSHIFARIVKLIRLCTEEEINMIHNYVYETRDMHTTTLEKIRSIYIDALAVAGTKVTVTHLVDKITSMQISAVKAAQLMKNLAEIRIPSEQIADVVFTLCESDVAIRNPFLRQSCMLTYGSILNGVCGENLEKMAIETENLKTCSRSMKEKLVRRLIEKFEHFETRYEKVLVLKTLANAAIDVSVFDLEKIILDKRVEKVVRIQAIESLRRLRTTMSRKIQNILMPVYKNRLELPELRMTALHMIMQTVPEQSLIDLIVRGIETERSTQVKTFTYYTLKTLSKSTLPCEELIAMRVMKALKMLPEVEINMLDSRINSYSVYNRGYQTGMLFNWATIFSNDSILPKEVMTSLETLFGGEWNKYFAQIGFTQNNLDVILTKVLTKVEKMGLDELVVRGKRSAFFRPTELLRSLIEKLRITRRELSNDETHALLYFRYKDMDYAFLPIDIDTIPEMIKNAFHDGKIDLSEIERLLVKGTHFMTTGAAFIHETTRRIPTTLGLPVVLSSKMPTIASIKGHIKINFEPKHSETFHGLRLRLVAQPELASTHVTKIEILCPIVSTGVKMLHAAKINPPVDTELLVNWEHKLTIKTIVKALESKKHIVHLMSRPVTFVRMFKKTMRIYPEPVEQTIFLKESLYPVHEVERTYFNEFGTKVVVSGNLRRSPIFFEGKFPSALLITDNVIDVVIEPTTELREYVFNMELEAFLPVHRMEMPSLKHFTKKVTRDLFEVEDSEYKYEDETERLESFNTYTKDLKINKAYKNRIFFKVETVGDRHTKEAQLDLTAICDDKIRYCRLNVEARRSPIAEETRHWELKTLVQTLYPEMPKSLKDMYNQLHREFVAQIETTWGCEEKNTMTIQIQGEQSREQKKWMKFFEREQNELTLNEKLVEASKLNQYKMLAEYELTPFTKYHIERLFSMLKSWKMWNTQVEVLNKQMNHVEAVLTIEPVNRMFFNLTVETPLERVVLKEITMPFSLPTMNIRRHFGNVHSIKHVVKSLEHSTRAECVIKSNEVQTFDKLFFRAPLTTCYSVLAKDCSSETPEFAVLMKKLNKDSEEKKIKIISREHVIELEMVDNEMIVRVNGKIIDSVEKMLNYGITLKSKNLFVIDIDSVLVHFDGFHAEVKLSALYKNKQCGLCGHFDGEKINDFRRADNFETEDIEEFHRSFLTKDDECEMEEMKLSKKTNYKILSEETSSSEEYDYTEKTIKPVLRTRVLERGQRVCFSVEPVMECVDETRGMDLRSVQTTFKCLRRSLSLTHRLLRLARNDVVSVEDLETVEDVFEHKIRVPKMCTVY